MQTDADTEAGRGEGRERGGREEGVTIPRDVARLAADGCEVRADELSDAATEAYEGWDEERGEDLQRRSREYRRVVETIREALLNRAPEEGPSPEVALEVAIRWLDKTMTNDPEGADYVFRVMCEALGIEDAQDLDRDLAAPTDEAPEDRMDAKRGETYRNPGPCERHKVDGCVSCDEQVPVPEEGDREQEEHKCRIFDDPSLFLLDFLAPEVRWREENWEKVTTGEIWRAAWFAALEQWCEMQQEIDQSEGGQR